ncbi:MAG: hypothetical protein RXR43_08665 [Sulfolobus sp.]
MTTTYIVIKDDLKKFKKVIQDKSKNTVSMGMRYLRRALAELGYEFKPRRDP